MLSIVLTLRWLVVLYTWPYMANSNNLVLNVKTMHLMEKKL
ncbi:hypothetical protein KC19_VG112600 [Ceratodon purpureus]|uniref:Uncharacterized protein n=1 Tax=Ceratodon purpureus TaxID=3225 RepID=A0A8T0HPF2_CERPU|nr:hypothetical protein KC19_VG112600 [Ceratodon purpureus]